MPLMGKSQVATIFGGAEFCMRKHNTNTCTKLAAEIDALERDGKDVPDELMDHWETKVKAAIAKKRAMRNERGIR